jgi:hypothetical protein
MLIVARRDASLSLEEFVTVSIRTTAGPTLQTVSVTQSKRIRCQYEASGVFVSLSVACFGSTIEEGDCHTSGALRAFEPKKVKSRIRNSLGMI